MSRFFIDTEFIDTGREIDLISIGIVSEDGRELYLQSHEYDDHAVTEWIQNNVIVHLRDCPEKIRHPMCISQDRDGVKHIINPACPWNFRHEMRDKVRAFITDPTELWGWCAGYDFVAFCQLFGTMMDLPPDWPHYIHDLQHVLDERGILDEELPQQEEGLHNALADAKHIKRLWEWLYPQSTGYMWHGGDIMGH